MLFTIKSSLSVEVNRRHMYPHIFLKESKCLLSQYYIAIHESALALERYSEITPPVWVSSHPFPAQAEQQLASFS